MSRFINPNNLLQWYRLELDGVVLQSCMTREEHDRLLAFATGRAIQPKPTAPIDVSEEEWTTLLADACCVDATVTADGGLVVIQRPNWSYTGPSHWQPVTATSPEPTAASTPARTSLTRHGSPELPVSGRPLAGG